MDTLGGVAIKYGVEVADIKRLNGLVTDLQMFALKSLNIPLPGRHPPSLILSNGLDILLHHLHLLYPLNLLSLPSFGLLLLSLFLHSLCISCLLHSLLCCRHSLCLHLYHLPILITCPHNLFPILITCPHNLFRPLSCLHSSSSLDSRSNLRSLHTSFRSLSSLLSLLFLLILLLFIYLFLLPLLLLTLIVCKPDPSLNFLLLFLLLLVFLLLVRFQLMNFRK
ncbi:unnamed protein product [Camellia sinensis]